MNIDELQDGVNAAYKAVYQADRDAWRENTPKAWEACHKARGAAAVAEHKLEQAIEEGASDGWAGRELQQFTADQLLAELRRRLNMHGEWLVGSRKRGLPNSGVVEQEDFQ